MKLEFEKEHFEDLNYFRNIALEETVETDREYHRLMIGEWHDSIAGLNVKKDALLDELKAAAKAKDYRRMQQIFFTYKSANYHGISQKAAIIVS